MTTLTVTATNAQLLEGGRVAYGTQTIRNRHGEYETYLVRLSAKASAFVEEGDVLEWWDCGPSQLPYIPCGGQIIKKDGQKVQLEGDRDCGIDTGHPPQLGLKMVQKLGIKWVSSICLDEPSELPPLYKVNGAWHSGEWFTPSNGEPLSRFNLKPFTLPEAPRGWQIKLIAKNPRVSKEGVEVEVFHAFWQKKFVAMVDSDQPLIK